jgi:hypothetical protein
VYYDFAASDAVRRQHLYDGHSPRWSISDLVDFPRSLIEDAFGRGDRPKLSSGKNRADWVCISDVIEGFVTAATGPEPRGREMLARECSRARSSLSPEAERPTPMK